MQPYREIQFLGRRPDQIKIGVPEAFTLDRHCRYKSSSRPLGGNAPQQTEFAVHTTFGKEVVLDCSLTVFESRGSRHLLLAFGRND